jgi:putative transposase
LKALANAKAESFIKTLKSEEVYLQQYRDQEEARASIQRFIEEVYNRKRLHSALGYLSPDAFENRLRPDRGVDGGGTQ